jgi:hypothetical protein
MAQQCNRHQEKKKLLVSSLLQCIFYFNLQFFLQPPFQANNIDYLVSNTFADTCQYSNFLIALLQ